MAKLKPYVWYTRQQLRSMMTPEDATSLQWQGYVLRHDVMTDKFIIVKYTGSSAQAFDGGRKPTLQTVSGDSFGELPPIVKRTAQQRVDSLMAKWLVAMKAAGGLPTLMGDSVPVAGSTQAEKDEFYKRQAIEKKELDDQIALIVGEAWKEGRTEITADIVRQVATHFLQDAENKAT